MKNFKKRKATGYIWLVYLPFAMSDYFPIKSQTDWFWVGMGLLFLVSYVLVTEVPRWHVITMPLELLITGIFSIFAFNNYLIIFPGWQIASLLARRPKKYFHWFLGAYYLFIISGLIRYNSYYPGILSFHNMNVVGLLFPLISPIFAYSLARSMVRQNQLHQTNRRLQTIVQRDEHERIARDLHDTLGQSFSMITIKTELAKKLLQKAPEKVVPELDDIEKTSRQNLQMVRKIVNDLHQKSISETLLEQSKNLAAAEVLLTTNNEEMALKWPTVIQGRFTAAMTEALTNVIRHAKAQSVQISFTSDARHYQVLIQDDGRGHKFERSGSNGIRGMRARMLEGNGKFEIVRNRKGTLVTLSLPKE
ncbi:sensor histidine kinase [Pediococcus damnosus]|uniref:histidine kinase n=1 Tax=Pediococcus damnosus TaxID=51663 RepID=A0AAC9B018_9LACO|nr:sensor histidine kinase [Pediococcus damnosus]AMV61963.1 sensor histidine kinase [Pediococcus damnosus]